MQNNEDLSPGSFVIAAFVIGSEFVIPADAG
jgi:hypothetical protein